MKKTALFLSLFILFVLHVVLGQQDGGTCSAEDGGTCSSGKEESEDKLCFPDGACFGSLAEASAHYKGGDHVIELKFPQPYGENQKIGFTEKFSNTFQTLALMHEYMTNLFQNDTAKPFRDDCKLKNPSCAYWASIGECEKNPKYMHKNCNPACQSCHALSFEHRCPFDKNAPKAWGPGDLNKMFERLTTEPYYIERYEPTILSRPPEGPWVITLENVTTREQCERLIELGSDRGYNRSKTKGKTKADGTLGESNILETRTSYTAWCKEQCLEDETTQRILANIENITGIPDANSEHLQLLRYEETQRYGKHHDYIHAHLDRFFGPRLITVFLYLSEVEEGGGTRFNNLGLTVQPKIGRAVIWPSVFDHDPDEKDIRTEHEALAVVKGVKYAANAWVHQRDFKETLAKHCSN